MSVTIRLRRMGKKKQPHYRIVAADSRAPRDGRFVENLGYYNPLPDPATLSVDLSRVDYWLGQGARVSPTVRSLVSKARAGGDGTVALAVADSGAEAEAEAQAANGNGAGAPATAAGSDEAAEATAGPAEAADTPEPAAEPAEAAAPGDTAGSEPAPGSGAA